MGGTITKHVTALGLSKATHEVLTLHCFAIDSAACWEQLLNELLPQAQFPGAVVRRAVALSFSIEWILCGQFLRPVSLANSVDFPRSGHQRSLGCD